MSNFMEVKEIYFGDRELKRREPTSPRKKPKKSDAKSKPMKENYPEDNTPLGETI